MPGRPSLGTQLWKLTHELRPWLYHIWSFEPSIGEFGTLKVPEVPTQAISPLQGAFHSGGECGSHLRRCGLPRLKSIVAARKIANLKLYA